MSANNEINPVETAQSSASDDIVESSVDNPCTPAAKQQPLSVFSSRQTLDTAQRG